MRDFRQLKVWEESHLLTLEVYRLTREFPKEELFALTNQMRRAAASIGSNIAEGCGRGSNKEYAHFVQIALGSAFEIDYQLMLSKDLEYCSLESYKILSEKVDKVKRQLASLLKKIRETL